MVKTKSEKLSNIMRSISKKIEKEMFAEEQVSDFDGELSHRRIRILEFIGEEYRTMGEIASEIHLTAGTTTTIIDKMIKLDFLKRERNENIDRRKVFISLTEKGLRVFKKFSKMHNKATSIMLKNISKEEQDLFVNLLEKIEKNL